MMEPQSQLIAMKQLRNPLKTHHAPNHIPRLQVRNTTRSTRLRLDTHGRINKQRQRRVIQQKIEQMTNGLIGSIRDIEKALLMGIERTNEVFMKCVDFDVKLGLVRQVDTEARRLRIVIDHAQRRRQNANIVKIDGVIFVG